ncbi:uncharacterized protein [Eurosta solidaginis]|uniref:uncharacterized protein n=1 Tax=Eurosta solidaginis TaxID=178769 RepID=UPI003530A58E
MDFIDDFIEEYKNNPCLWKADCTNFKNRSKRQEAYLKLIEVAAKHGEHYNIERTKQKINNLRCAFRQQLKKFIEAKNKGEKDETYCPKRRYFESLMFLKDEENIERKPKRCDAIGSSSNTGEIDSGILEQDFIADGVSEEQLIKIKRSTINSSDHNLEVEHGSKSISQNDLMEDQAIEESFNEYSDDVYNKMNGLIHTEKNSKQQKLFECEKESSFLQQTANGRKRSPSTSSQLSKDIEPVNKKAFRLEADTIDLERLLSLTCKSHTNVEDHYTSLGNVIAHKLRTMDNTQAIYAEKIITDVLFHGQLKLLSISSINQFINVNYSDLCEAVRCNK